MVQRISRSRPSVCGVQSPGSMCHLVGVVVQSYDGFPLLYARQYRHQCSVCHHQVQVVLGEVKVHRLKAEERHIFLIFTLTMSLQYVFVCCTSFTYNVKEDLAGVDGVQQLTHMVLLIKDKN